MPDTSLAEEQKQVIYNGVLANMWRSRRNGTVAVIVGVIAVVCIALYYNTPWTDALFTILAMLGIVVMGWGHYFFVKYRMRKGYFGNNLLEFTELFSFVMNGKRNKK